MKVWIWRPVVMGALCVVLAVLAVGCERGQDDSARIDVAWHRRALVEGLLVHWLDAAPTASGFMLTAFDRHWKASAEQPGDLTEQARLVYSFAIGYETTRDKRYLDAANRGADFLLTRFRDSAHGGFFKRVSRDGTVISDAKDTYGHAFVLFALSHMFRVTGDARYRTAALLTWSEINTRLRNPKGGFRGGLPRDFSQAGQANAVSSQNPMMHLFEALLALHDATHDPVALAGARDVANFVVYRLLTGTPDGGAYIPEWYDSEWKPLAAGDSGPIDIGHQFEWIHMLLAADRRGLAGVYAQTAERMLKFAVKGYDETDGGVFSMIYADGQHDRDKYWWKQCEALRTFLAVASEGGHPEMWRRYDQTLELVRDQFIDRENGGWYSKACKRGGCPDPQVEPYHMTGLHNAAMSLAVASK